MHKKKSWENTSRKLVKI